MCIRDSKRTFHIEKTHIDPGNHHILCLGISEIEHIVDHLLFFFFNHTVLVAYIYDRPQLILRHGAVFRVGVYPEQKEHAIGELSLIHI